MAYTDIDKPTDYFETKLYTGNGSTQNITGLDFAPNWVWIKSRTSSRVHCLFDTVRGATKRLQTNESDAEYTTSNSLTAFNSDGFSLGSYNQSNEGSANFVSWNWKAGTSVSGNTTGSGTSKSYTGSVNTDAGFSIIKYIGNGTSGHTIPHHLGVQPQVVICKRINQGGQWVFGSTALPNQFEQFLELDLTGGVQTSSLRWNDTDPSSSVFTVGSTLDTNANDINIIAYSFSQKKGYSEFSSYIGNGSTDGAFVYTGFKPAFVIVKKSSGGDNWTMADNKRNGFNPDNDALYPNLSNAEANTNFVDLLSNGFKMRRSDGAENGSGSTYIYMAFAKNPFVTSTGIPATAR